MLRYETKHQMACLMIDPQWYVVEFKGVGEEDLLPENGK